MKKEKRSRLFWKKWLLPIAVLMLIILVFQFFFSKRQTGLPVLVPENGVLEVTDADFFDQIYQIDSAWAHFPGRLCTSEDFAPEGGEPLFSANPEQSAFGTYRLVLKAPPKAYLALCGFSPKYGARVFVNGLEVLTLGNVADCAGEAVPAAGYMTIPIYTGDSGQVEILCQYSNFVRTVKNVMPHTCLSSLQNIEKYKEGNALVSITLSGAMLILSLYFLLSASIQRQRSQVTLAFCCLLMVLRDNLFWETYLLPPGVSWFFTYRTSLIVDALLPMAFLLLLRSIYPVSKKWPFLTYASAMGIDVLLLLFCDPDWGRWCCIAAYIISLPYLLYLVWGVVRYFRKNSHRIQAADVLSICGLAAFFVALLSEILLFRRSDFAAHFGLTPSGMLICILLIAVSISLRIQAQEAALAESRSREEMLKRMNALNLDFLHKVAHELKTPLTVISGYAQLAGMQIEENKMSRETPENLKIIQKEAMRLADLVTKLMDYSYGDQIDPAFSTVEVGPLLDRVQAICTPMCLKNGNHVEVSGRHCADVYGNQEMLLQIFINLVVNANRHMKGGTVTIRASDEESREYVVFRVQDAGSGIPQEVQQHLFEKGYSGDDSSGLGLSVCRDVVEAHGGTIEMEKTGPDGTVFAFTILKRGLEK